MTTIKGPPAPTLPSVTPAAPVQKTEAPAPVAQAPQDGLDAATPAAAPEHNAVAAGPKGPSGEMSTIVDLIAHPDFGDGPNAKPGIGLTVADGIVPEDAVDFAGDLDADLADPTLADTDYQRALRALKAELPNGFVALARRRS